MTAKRKRPTWIPVVAGIIRRGDEVLLGKRPEGTSMAGVWEFPGGKIEPGEKPQDALKRELFEELAIDAEVGELKFATSHQYGETNILLMFFEVSYWKGEPKTAHHDDLAWSQISRLATVNLPDANREALDQIYIALGYQKE